MEAPPQVDPMPFYEACVQDSCSCDTGGDCECFCSAVASYAQQCTKEGACVFWRTPDLCRECPPALAPRPPRGGVGAAERWAGLLLREGRVRGPLPASALPKSDRTPTPSHILRLL